MRVYPLELNDPFFNMDIIDGIMMRFHIGARLMKMNYGDAVIISEHIVQKAWPPTGDYDRTAIGVFRAIALSNAGHRPESSYTTEQRITNDLDGSFQFEQHPFERKWIFKRKLSACPHCRGEGKVRKFREIPARAVFSHEIPSDINETIAYDIEDCKHEPV